MTRYFLFIVCITVVILACNDGPSKAKLVGTWKIKDMAYAGDSIIGTATFSQTNTMVVRTIVRGETVDSAIGSYELSGDNKFLTTTVDALSSKFEITKLTNDLLELKGENKMNTTVYIRYED